MSAPEVLDVIASLRSLGLNLELTSERALRISPASLLTTELRVLIRGHRDDLIAWLQTDAGLLSGVNGWEAQSAIYQLHHFTCRICVAAGLGYGPRCGVGMALWHACGVAPAAPKFRHC